MTLPINSFTLSFSPDSLLVAWELPRFQGGTNDFLGPFSEFGPVAPKGVEGNEGASDSAASLCLRFGGIAVVVLRALVVPTVGGGPRNL